MSKDITALESGQKFAAKLLQNVTLDLIVSTKSCWKLVQYPQSLAEHRTKLKLCQLYNILHGHCYFPQDIFVCPSNHYSTRSHHMLIISQPFATPILFYIHYLYPIPYLCGKICLNSKYLLPPYKFLRNYFNYCFISSCTFVVLVCLINFLFVGTQYNMLHISIILRYCTSIVYCKNYYKQKTVLRVTMRRASLWRVASRRDL